MTCAESYADANDFGLMFCETVSSEDEPQINFALRLAANRINMARQAQGACDCTLSAASTEYLKWLNCLLALVFHNCKCTNIRTTPEEKALYMEAVRLDLDLIRTGNLELCEGETGADFPYTGWADQGTTEFARVRIIANDILRNS